MRQLRLDFRSRVCIRTNVGDLCACEGEEEEEGRAYEFTENGDDVATDGERKHLDAFGEGVGYAVVGLAAVRVVGSHAEGCCGYIEGVFMVLVENVEVMLAVISATQQ